MSEMRFCTFPFKINARSSFPGLSLPANMSSLRTISICFTFFLLISRLLPFFFISSENGLDGEDGLCPGDYYSRVVYELFLLTGDRMLGLLGDFCDDSGLEFLLFLDP